MAMLEETPATVEAEALILDRMLPVWDATSRHFVVAEAPPTRVFEALSGLDLVDVVRSSAGARALIGARAVPIRVADFLRGRPASAPEHLPLRDARPWVVLGEEEPHQLVVGAIGRFWGPGIEWLDVEAPDFAAFARPGYGKIAWGFALYPYGEDRTLVVDECRTRVTDPVSRQRFLRYWSLVGGGAGFVMRRTLDVVKRQAERPAAR